MQHKVVSQDEWVAARKAHLKNEKALTRMRGHSNAQMIGEYGLAAKIAD